MIELRTSQELEQMRPVGGFVARVLTELAAQVEVGLNLMDLEHHARHLIERHGATSCYWDYAPSFGDGPFRNVLCTAVNDAVLHGLPHDYSLRNGDLLSLDFAASLGGWVADSALSVVVGEADPEDERLIRATEEALAAGIDQARPGRKIGDISAAIGAVAADFGYPVNDEFGGHGVGRTMHEDPHVPNTGRPGRGFKLVPGVVIAIEPWFMRTTDKIYRDRDGWTLRSADGSRGAHSEHTVAVTDDGPVVLTARERVRTGTA